jgi:hypothetical protein
VGNFNITSRTHTQIQIEYLQYQSNAQALISTSGEQESKSRRGSAYRKKKKLVTFEKNSTRIMRHSRAVEKVRRGKFRGRRSGESNIKRDGTNDLELQ